MAVEVLSFDLSQRGVPVGTFDLRTESRGGTVHLGGKLQLSGALGRMTISQTSRTHVRHFNSLSFREEQQKRGDNRTYDLKFDRSSGLVKAVRSGSDKAEHPLVRPYRDPLGMLYEIRQLDGSAAVHSIPMLGKDVQVSFVQTGTLETAVGPRQVRIYRLFPGGSLLWIGEDDGNLILKMQQRTSGLPVEAVLTRVGQEPGSGRESGSGSRRQAAAQPRDGRRSRSRRGRRRRPKKD